MTARALLLLGVLWLVSLVATYRFAATNVHNAVEAQKVPAIAKVITDFNKAGDAGHVVEVQAETRKAKTEATFQKIDSEVQTHAQEHSPAADCSIDADGLRIWREANANTLISPHAEAPAAGQHDDAMPGAAPTDQRHDAGSAGQPRGDGEAVPPVRGAAGRLGEVVGNPGADPVSADPIDDAAVTEEEMRTRALDAQAQRAGLRGKTVDDSATWCAVCDESIPALRRAAVPGVQTCIVCQAGLEHALTVHTRGY